MAETKRVAAPAEIFDLSGQVSLVTGGNGGFGRVIASGLAAAGSSVVIADVQLDGADDIVRSVESSGQRCLTLEMDVTDAESVQAAVDRVASEFGRIDVLVNSHGVTKRRPFIDYSEADWDHVLDINLKGTFLTCQSVGRVMLQQGRGAIVNLSSVGGLVGMTNTVAYCASKGGVVQLTRALGVEWAARGVRVNAIAPSAFDTPMARNAIEAEPAYQQRVIDRTPVGRLGDPEELIGAVLFLASGASAMMAGAVLPVDGGFTAQ